MSETVEVSIAQELRDARERMFSERNAALPEDERSPESYPPGATCIEDVLCFNENDGYKCTAAKGHKGNRHVAHGRLGHICHAWPVNNGT